MCFPRRDAGSYSTPRAQARHMNRLLTMRWPVVLALLMPIVYSIIAFAAAVGDQVELNATHQAGVPLHQEPRGTNDFQRIPDGTRAHVIDVAKGGQWLK
jgi:hypothetical protein